MQTLDTYTLMPKDFPSLLKEIPDPPKQLNIRGTLPDPKKYHYLTVVGSRKYTEYGKKATEHLISNLKGYPICIVSGLALGIDALAHETALKAELPALAIPGSGLSDKVLYPKSNRYLADKILKSGGALLSEYENDFKATAWSFPKRNRIKAGISEATLIIEAEEKSGTLITARLANEYNRDVLAVAGSLFSPTSAGTHYLIQEGATPVRRAVDILEVFRLANSNEQQTLFSDISEEERHILRALRKPRTKESLISEIDLPHSNVMRLLESLRAKGYLIEKLGKLHRIHR